MNPYWKTAADVDRRLAEAGIEYCVIKTYGANPDFFDSNIDVVVRDPLRDVAERAWGDFKITLKDEIKTRFYEHNKLMCKPHDPEQSVDIHLHSNAGWNDMEMVSGEEILANKVRHELEGLGGVYLLEPGLDAKVLTLQVMFENFKKKRWDGRFLTAENYAEFAEEYGVSEEEIAPIRDAELYIEWGPLIKVWKKYYPIRKNHTRITPWNYFLHGLLASIQGYRRRAELAKLES